MVAVSDISVVICAYTESRWDELLSGIDSLRSQTLRPREIVVVIDHNDVLLARLRTGAPDVVAVKNSEEKGLSGARNSGISASHGSVIAFIDDDAVANPDWLERLAEGLRDDQVMGVGGAIEPFWQGGKPAWFPEEFRWVVGCTYKGMPETPTNVRNLIGCNMAFRREAFELAGGFRSGIGRVGTIPVGCEETEFCIRLSQRVSKKASLLYYPLAGVQHLVPSSRGTWGYFFSRCRAEGLSKAIVAGFVGSNKALSTERAYVSRVLPAAVARGVTDTLFRGDFGGIQRAWAVLAGLVVTGVGFVWGGMGRQEAAYPIEGVLAPSLSQGSDL